MVKLTACGFAIYGGLDAKLEHFSADTITNEGGESFCLIKVRTECDYLGSSEGSLRIIPGITATVDILTGEKSVLDYLLMPVPRAREKHSASDSKHLKGNSMYVSKQLTGRPTNIYCE